jgi:serine phosphatase RsbU (regulator of sigma subunit)
MNAENEEWGEKRLCTTVTSSRDGLPLASLLDRLLDSADAHAAGAPQHDDMTMVAVLALPID